MELIYETFIWWLTLWLPSWNDLAWMLDDASYDTRKDEFWEAIAPEPVASAPWHFRDYKPVVPLTVSEINEFVSLVEDQSPADLEEFA